MSERPDKTGRDGGGEGFLGRWSRRKRREGAGDRADEGGHGGSEAGTGAAAPTPADDSAAPSREDTGPATPGPDAPSHDAGAEPPEPAEAEADILRRLGLPHPDKITDPAQLRRLMAEHVPAHLRRLALRRLWRLDPVLANVDGLNDYDEDFTGRGKAADLLRTAWRAGRGYGDNIDGAEGRGESAGATAAPEAARAVSDAPGQASAAGEGSPAAPHETMATGGEVGARSAGAEVAESRAEREQPAANDTERAAETPPRPSARKRMRFSVKRP